MEDIMLEYKLSLYNSLITLSRSNKTKVELVQNTFDGIIYIKKTMKNYNIEVYKLLKDVESINFPKIYEIIEDKKELIVIEEFINGCNFEDILKRDGVLVEDKAIDYISTLCDALSKIHLLESPVIHRDIKPSNILLDSYGTLKLIDFDASRVYKKNANKDTEVLGTHGYAAPEQFVSVQTDGRSDIYSLGVLFNMLLVGKDPREEITNGRVKNIIEKCISLDPKNRYQSVIELKSELEKFNIDEISNIKNKEKILEKIDKNKYIKDSETTEEIKNKAKGTINGIIREIPGFRTGKSYKYIIAIIWYLFLLSGFLFAGTADNQHESMEYLTTVGMLILLWLLYTNFKNITSRIPLLKGGIVIKIVGYIVYTIMIVAVSGWIISS